MDQNVAEGSQKQCFGIIPMTDASGLQEAWLGDWWYQQWGSKWATTGNQLGSC